MQELDAEGRHRLEGTCGFLGEQRVHIISPQAIPENNSLQPELGGTSLLRCRRRPSKSSGDGKRVERIGDCWSVMRREITPASQMEVV